ncbi:hypothetical protein MKX01_024236 [Papaver californicum]|nr:hypothetical protein MKX01_024236 [Papaver californicum]
MALISKNLIMFLRILLFLGFWFEFGQSFKVPFRVNDVLPVLPRQVSWPLLNNFHSAVDLLPSFVGSVSPNNGSIEWKGACFYGNEARMEFTSGSTGDDKGLGGGVLYLKTDEAHSWTCMDLYVFATPYRVTWDYYFSAREHTLKIDAWEEPAELEYVVSLMSMWTRVQPAYAANMWNEALNKRLGTEGLDLYGILDETEKRGITFDHLLTIPEQDDWVYSDGKSTTCVAFILEMYKEAGLFGPISSSIQVTEFTIRDAYVLRLFENNRTRLPIWCNNENDQLPFCQILGEYRMELPQYNTIEPYAKMNENCPSLPPTYERPLKC